MKRDGGLCLTVGMFDGVHLGHRHLLDCVTREAGRRGLTPAVLTFGRHPRALLESGGGPALLTPGGEKTALLGAAGIGRIETLDFTPALARLTAREFMAQCLVPLGVEVLVAGYDHRFGHDRAEGFDDYVRHGRALGIDVVRADEYAGLAGVSSSAIRRLLAGGDAAGAARMLGRPYRVEGTVVAGRREGRRLGFPTANLRTDPLKLIPARGVYACRADAGGHTWPAMVNIGCRPTLDNGADVTLEAHLLGYAGGDLYGKPLALDFAGRLRPERRFGSRLELAAQLEADARHTLQLLEP